MKYLILVVALTLACVKPTPEGGSSTNRQAREFLYDLYGQHACS